MACRAIITVVNGYYCEHIFSGGETLLSAECADG